MPRTRTRFELVTGAVLALALLAACGNDDSASSKEPVLQACPSDSPPAGAPAGGGAGPAGLTMAKTIAPSDTSTSVVIDPSKSPQIQCGRVEVQTHSGVVYSTPTTAGKAVSLKLDVQVPKTDGAKPLVVYLSGGGFSNSSTTAALDQRTFVAKAGYVVASVQYRTTANSATYVDGISDVKAAIRYLRAHAADYGIDPARVAVWGESAGGYLAAMVGTNNGVKKYEVGQNLDQSSDVQAVVDKFGPSDLARTASDFDAAAQTSYDAPGSSTAAYVFGPGTKKSVTSDPAAIAAASPMTTVDGTDPAFLLFHGSADKLVSPSQTLLLHTALRKAGVDSTRYVVEGAGHGDFTFGTDSATVSLWSTQEVMGHITTFLADKLHS
jgi:acetyl esterase/lipase